VTPVSDKPGAPAGPARSADPRISPPVPGLSEDKLRSWACEILRNTPTEQREDVPSQLRDAAENAGYDDVTASRAIKKASTEVRKRNPGSAGSGGGTSRPRLTPLSDIQPERIEFLMPGFIPLSAVTVLEGRAGIGKSTLTADLSARVSAGRSMPGSSESGTPADVLIFCTEDSPATTIRPRIEQAGGNVKRVHCLEAPGPGEPRFVLGPDCAGWLRDQITSTGAILVVIDPLSSFAGGANLHNDQQCRELLNPLVEVARSTGAAIVLVRHLNKNRDADAMDRGMGSVGIGAIARSVVLVAEDPKERGRVVITLQKANLTESPSSRAFRLVPSDDPAIGRIAWEQGTTPERADDLLGDGLAGADDRPQVDQLAEFLREVIQEEGGRLPVKEFEHMAREKGFTASPSTLGRAAKRAGAVAQKSGFGKGADYVYTMVVTSPPGCLTIMAGDDHGGNPVTRDNGQDNPGTRSMVVTPPRVTTMEHPNGNSPWSATKANGSAGSGQASGAAR